MQPNEIHRRMFHTYNDLLEYKELLTDEQLRLSMAEAAWAIANVLELAGVWEELTKP